MSRSQVVKPLPRADEEAPGERTELTLTSPPALSSWPTEIELSAQTVDAPQIVDLSGGLFDALETFAAEGETPQTADRLVGAAASPRSVPLRLSWPWLPTPLLAGLVGLAAVVVGAAYIGFGSREPTPATTPPVPEGRAPINESLGSAQFDSRPSGAEVVIDGQVRGKTPLRVTLPTGAHTLEIRGAHEVRSLPLTIESGVLVSQYVELIPGPLVPSANVTTGRLDVTSEPTGARVQIDGITQGTTPVSLDAVAAGEHQITLSHAHATVKRRVKIVPGASASIVVSFPAAPAETSKEVTPSAVGGWVAIDAPFELQVFEGGRFLGTSQSERLMLPAGRHELELVNAALEIRTSVSHQVRAGAIGTVTVPIPTGRLSVNATPWAEVTIDGQPMGTTPLANLAVAVGRHDVVWRHPQFGERRQPVTVAARTPARVSVDFTP